MNNLISEDKKYGWKYGYIMLGYDLKKVALNDRDD